MGWFSKNKKPKMIECETEMFNVIQNLVTQPDCAIEINPEDMTYMLSLDKEQYYLYIDGQGVQFSNHGFIIIRNYSSVVLDSYIELIRNETIRRRTAKRNEIFKNECNLLKTINGKLIERTPKTEQTETVA